MSAARRLAAVVVACGITVAGCADLDFVMDLFTVTDLSTSDDPAERAAADAEQERAQKQAADEAIDKALAGDTDQVLIARAARPEDPTYAAYEATLIYLTEEDIPSFGRSMDRLDSLWLRSHPDPFSDESDRKNRELKISTLERVLATHEGDEVPGRREQLERTYCIAIENYERKHGENVYGQTFLLFVNRRSC